jgi:hypothetical protein
MGIISKNVPSRIRAVKAAAISCVADSFGNFGISDSNYTPGQEKVKSRKSPQISYNSLETS